MAKTLLSIFFDQVHRFGNKRVALREKRGDEWRDWSWADYGEQVSRVAEGFRALGLGKGSRIAVLAENSPEWLFTDIAAMSIGGASVGVYPTELSENIRYLVEHSGASVLVLDTPEQLAKTDAWRKEIPSLKKVVIIKPHSDTELDDSVITWKELLDSGAGDYEEEPGKVEKEARSQKLDQLAMLVYTSGTTGPPKGAMYSHSNLIYEASAVSHILNMDDLTTISFLPMSHIAEKLQGQLIAILLGGTVNFAESIEKLKDNLVEVRPTCLLCVPRVWEKFHAAITAKFSEATGLKKMLFNMTLSTGRQAVLLRNQGQALPFFKSVRRWLLKQLVVKKLKAAMGLDRCQIYASGAAPLSKKISLFFGSLDIDIHEVYGLTESVGVCTANPIERIRFGTVGIPIEGCKVTIAEDGEICVEGPNVFMGYLNDEAATAEAIEKGVLKTGDIGEFDEEGYLVITDRKKDIIVTAGGKNVAPQNIENRLKTYPGISQVVVIGDKKRYLTALITLDPSATDKLCIDVGVSPQPPEMLLENKAIRERLQEYIDEINEEEARYAGIKRFSILKHELTADRGEVTPSLKIKRSAVLQNYSHIINAMYHSGQEEGR